MMMSMINMSVMSMSMSVMMMRKTILMAVTGVDSMGTVETIILILIGMILKMTYDEI